MIRRLAITWDHIIVALVVVGLGGALLAPVFSEWINPMLWKGMCHQMPERSLWIGDHAMPLCGRCTGIFIGFLIGRIWWQASHISVRKAWISLLLIGVMVAEWKLGEENWTDSTNWIRLGAGLAFGIGYYYWFHLFPLVQWMKLEGWKRSNLMRFLIHR